MLTSAERRLARVRAQKKTLTVQLSAWLKQEAALITKVTNEREQQARLVQIAKGAKHVSRKTDGYEGCL